jgi:hypothetical protein
MNSERKLKRLKRRQKGLENEIARLQALLLNTKTQIKDLENIQYIPTSPGYSPVSPSYTPNHGPTYSDQSSVSPIEPPVVLTGPPSPYE